MKFLKSFFLVIIVISMFFVIAVIQLQFALQKTVLSPGYFEKLYEKNEMDAVLESAMKQQISKIGQDLIKTESDTSSVPIDPGKYIDTKWLAKQAETAVSGVYAYFMGTEEKLPQLDISPVKTIIAEMAADQMIFYGGFESSIAILDAAIQDYKDKAGLGPEDEIDQDAVKSIAAEYEAMGVSEEVLGAVIETDKTLGENAGGDERIRLIAAEIIKQQMGLDKINEELDLNAVFENVYPEEVNPLAAVKSIIGAIKTTLFNGLLIVLLLLVLIVVFTAFKPAPVLGWLSAPFIAGGLFGMGFWMLKFILPMDGGIAEAFNAGSLKEGVDSITSFAQGYVNGIFTFILIQAAGLLVLGIIFIVIAKVLSSNEQKGRRYSAENNKKVALLAARIIMVVGLMVGVFFISGQYFLKIYSQIESAAEILNQSKIYSENISKAIFEEINLPVDKIMTGGQ